MEAAEAAILTYNISRRVVIELHAGYIPLIYKWHEPNCGKCVLRLTDPETGQVQFAGDHKDTGDTADAEVPTRPALDLPLPAWPSSMPTRCMLFPLAPSVGGVCLLLPALRLILVLTPSLLSCGN